MDLHADAHHAMHQVASNARLEPMLVRLPPSLAQQLRDLARATRIRQSDYLREAVADLVAKYQHVTLAPRSEG
jgi:predicted transcriptional regulator